jgi:hypothetical protein
MVPIDFAFDPLRTLENRERRTYARASLSRYVRGPSRSAAGERVARANRHCIFDRWVRSEWCPAGNVLLDLSNGEYSFTARAPRRICSNPNLERPRSKGRLPTRRLAELRSAYVRAQAEGLDSCRNGRRGELIISNGGEQILTLTSGTRSTSAPDELGCWTGAALALHRALSEIFPSPR